MSGERRLMLTGIRSLRPGPVTEPVLAECFSVFGAVRSVRIVSATDGNVVLEFFTEGGRTRAVENLATCFERLAAHVASVTGGNPVADARWSSQHDGVQTQSAFDPNDTQLLAPRDRSTDGGVRAALAAQDESIWSSGGALAFPQLPPSYAAAARTGSHNSRPKEQTEDARFGGASSIWTAIPRRAETAHPSSSSASGAPSAAAAAAWGGFVGASSAASSASSAASFAAGAAPAVRSRHPDAGRGEAHLPLATALSSASASAASANSGATSLRPSLPPLHRRHSPPPPPAAAYAAPQRLQPHTSTLKLRGLPFSARANDIAAFFAAAGAGCCVVRGWDPPVGGRPSGVAYAEFPSVEAARNAYASCHRGRMGRRYVEIFASSPEEVEHAAASVHHQH